ncbi:MAG: hypothetical protein CVV31_12070 [Methanomicrobiales archaeon HGW-Methanomicrobiales-2]|jgi:hypothetical protein|nr:MAG: hypothetical protein CVV31_12070 [Methanomicrobiales archaeon HGW-Methanomicrobiales-2]
MRCRLLVVLLALVVAQVFLSGCLSGEPQDLYTYFRYELSIRTATPIENVTLLVPIPTRGDQPAIGPEQISGELYTDPGNLRKGPSDPSTLPEHYDFAIIPVDGQYYLRLTTPYMNPAEPIGVRYYNRTSLGDKFRPEVVPRLIETRHPFGNESLFSPKQNLTLTASSSGTPNERGYYNPEGYRYSYTIPVYAHYENGTQVSISSEIEGSNRWLEGFDFAGQNRYSDAYSLTITGEPQGWMPAEGKVTVGQGDYREWQLNLSATSGSGG